MVILLCGIIESYFDYQRLKVHTVIIVLCTQVKPHGPPHIRLYNFSTSIILIQYSSQKNKRKNDYSGFKQQQNNN